MNSMDLVNEWLEISASDMSVASHLFETMRPRPFEVVCYHCQQAAEKALKAFLISKNAEPPKIHDLEKLCKLCAEYDGSFMPMLDTCRKLTDYAASARYPNSMEIEETDAEFALKQAGVICKFCGDAVHVQQQAQQVQNDRHRFEQSM